jgi:hypothetical protein
MDSGKRAKLMATPTPKKGRKVPPRATAIDPANDVKLPMVRSYAMDIPTDPAELAQFDRSVSSIFYRITGCVVTKTIKRKRVDAPGDKENVDPQEVAALEENDDQQEGESKGYLSENSPGRSDPDDDEQAFWAWQDNCQCPNGTMRSKCTCGACAPEFSFAKGKSACDT